MALFPDAKNVLHLFSGSLTPEGLSGFPGQHVRVDINPKCKPDIVCDAVTLSSVFEEETFDLVLADPPYSKEDAERYGVPMINRKKVLEEAAKVTTVGGNIVWLDQVAPIFRKSLLHMWGLIGIFRSTNNRFRMASIFSRVGK
ncbi:MAG: hypothetical protein D6698_04000 [Gammaproteobacteria bacterium]|nr:MAG: hypothetical protein D6698_04000 [Gammaproteobacteria bacterium]